VPREGTKCAIARYKKTFRLKWLKDENANKNNNKNKNNNRAIIRAGRAPLAAKNVGSFTALLATSFGFLKYMKSVATVMYGGSISPGRCLQVLSEIQNNRPEGPWDVIKGPKVLQVLKVLKVIQVLNVLEVLEVIYVLEVPEVLEELD
jgi:hypothetical protein